MSARRLGRRLLVVASVVVTATIAAAIWTNGTPAAQRDIRIDQGRHGNLQDIEDEIGRYWKAHKELPADLATLARQPGLELELLDPVTRQPYGYEITGPAAYRLCAVFTTDTAQWHGKAHPVHTRSRWLHGKGPMCFDRSTRAKDD